MSWGLLMHDLKLLIDLLGRIWIMEILDLHLNTLILLLTEINLPRTFCQAR